MCTSDVILFPVFELRSKRGKLLLETSSLIRCPLKNNDLTASIRPVGNTIWTKGELPSLFLNIRAFSSAVVLRIVARTDCAHLP
jgi:hypothetical protein